MVTEGYCFQEVDAKWSEIRAQAFLQFLLPPSSWQPHSMIRTDCKNLALVMKINDMGRMEEKLTIHHHTALSHKTMNTACYMYMYIYMLKLYNTFFYTPKEVLYMWQEQAC
jgi:hypothetical protein